MSSSTRRHKRTASSERGRTMREESHDDSDLADLLGSAAVPRPASGSYAKVQERVYHNYYQRHPSMSCCDYISAYLSMCCYYHPIICTLLVVLVGLFLLFLLASLVYNPTEYFGIAQGHSHAHIQSKFDLNMNQIDHWCLRGGNDDCACEDPLMPLSRLEHRSWANAFRKNKALVDQYVKDPLMNKELDVAFLGADIVEKMQGRWVGNSRTNPAEGGGNLGTLKALFSENFQSHDKGLSGVALGIAGDSAPHVLYRILHGEMPEGFDPHVWWIQVGMNDLGRMECSEEVVVIGILRLVEEILEHKPKARIVINSLFPMAVLREHGFPGTSETGDSKQSDGDVAPSRSEEPERRLLRTISTSTNIPRSGRQSAKQAVTSFAPSLKFQPEQLLFGAQSGAPRSLRELERVNPTLLDKDRIHKFRPGFLGKKKLPLFTSVRQINRELADFANNTSRVYFFDSTPLFTASAERGNKKVLKLLSHRISAAAYLTEQGYRVWEAEVSKRLKLIMDVMKNEAPLATDDVPNDVPELNRHWDIDDTVDLEAADEEDLGQGPGGADTESATPDYTFDPGENAQAEGENDGALDEDVQPAAEVIAGDEANDQQTGGEGDNAPNEAVAPSTGDEVNGPKAQEADDEPKTEDGANDSPADAVEPQVESQAGETKFEVDANDANSEAQTHQEPQTQEAVDEAQAAGDANDSPKEPVEPQLESQANVPQTEGEVIDVSYVAVTPPAEGDVSEPQAQEEVSEPRVEDAANAPPKEPVEPQSEIEVSVPQTEGEVNDVTNEAATPHTEGEVSEPRAQEEVSEPQVHEEVSEPQVQEEVSEPRVEVAANEPPKEAVEPQAEIQVSESESEGAAPDSTAQSQAEGEISELQADVGEGQTLPETGDPANETAQPIVVVEANENLSEGKSSEPQTPNNAAEPGATAVAQVESSEPHAEVGESQAAEAAELSIEAVETGTAGGAKETPAQGIGEVSEPQTEGEVTDTPNDATEPRAEVAVNNVVVEAAEPQTEVADAETSDGAVRAP